MDTDTDWRDEVNRLGNRGWCGDITISSGVGNKVVKRRYIELAGLRPAQYKYIVYNNSEINVVQALVERVFNIKNPQPGPPFVKPPLPDRHVFNQRMGQFRELLLEHLPPVCRMSLPQFVATTPVHKRKVYEHAYADYLKNGLNWRDARVTSFVKGEKVVGKAPRIIQPRGVKFNLIYGAFIRPIEKPIYRAIDAVFGRPTVVSGQNAFEVAAMLRDAWDGIIDPVAVPFDLSRMDQHISAVALNWEHGIYRRNYQTDSCYDTLDWCLRKTIKNVGRVYTRNEFGNKVVIDYKKDGSRMSGDMNTSLGNKTIMCGLLFSYFTGHCKFTPMVDYNVVDNGDDCVVIMSRTAYNNWKVMCQPYYEPSAAYIDPANPMHVVVTRALRSARYTTISWWFHQMGFTLTEEAVTDCFNHIRFCQSAPVFLDGRWVMVRDLKALGKDAYCLKPMTELPAWLGSVRAGGLAVYGNCPIYSAYYAALPEHAKAHRGLLKNASALYYLSRGMDVGQDVSVANRVAFYDTFGVSPREQMAIEEYYRTVRYNGDVSREHEAPPLPLARDE